MVKKKIFCFDIDGVICKTTKNNYASAKPYDKSIEIINKLYKKNYIIIFTSRYMGRNNDNVKKAKKEGYKKTLKQLKNWGLDFHELRFGKPTYDFFLDDKNIFFKSKWHNYFKKKYLK
jgi:CMP-N,N'-diacetyllegionaminic acid synthase